MGLRGASIPALKPCRYISVKPSGWDIMERPTPLGCGFFTQEDRQVPCAISPHKPLQPFNIHGHKVAIGNDG